MLRAFPFPFKITEQSKLGKGILDWLVRIFPADDQDLYSNFVSSIEKYRNILDFTAIQKQIICDYSLSASFELMINQYVSKILILEFLKSSIFAKSSDPEITFRWNNSLNPKSNLLEYNDLTYELISIFFNMMLIYYYQGIYFINIPERETKLKGIAKLRNSLWISCEILSRREHIEYSLSLDHDIRFLKVYQNYIRSIIITTMALLTKDQDDYIQQQTAGMWMKSLRFLEEANKDIESLESEFSSIKILKSIKLNIQFNLMYSNLNFLSIITSLLIDKAKEDSTNGYMGSCVYYTNMMKLSLEKLMKKQENSLLEESQRKYIQDEYKIISKLLDERTKLNDRLYVDKEVPCDNLTEFYDESATEVRILEPESLSELIESELKNISFSLSSIKILKTKLEKRISDSAGELDKEIYKLQIIKQGIYTRHEIEKILKKSAKNFLTPEIPKEVMDKIINLNKKGGLDILEAQISSIFDKNKKANTTLNEIESKLLHEQNEDASLSAKYGKDWDRLPSSQVNEKLVATLQVLKNKIHFSSSHDQKNAQFLENSRKWLKFFRGSAQDLSKDFVPENNTALVQEISKTVQDIKSLYSELSASLDDITSTRKDFDSIDYQNMLKQLFVLYRVESNSEKIVEHLFQSKAKEFDKLFDMIGKHANLLNTMTKSIYELARIEKDFYNLETAKSWLKALDNIEILRENLKNAELFYSQSLDHIADLKNNAEIYLAKREEEKIKAIGIIEYLEALKKKK